MFVILRKRNPLLVPLVLILGAMVALTGCGSRQEDSAPLHETVPQPVYEELEAATGLTETHDVFSTSAGVYAFEAEPDGWLVLTYYDRATATSRPLCQREGCTHDSQDCPACYTEPSTRALFPYQGKLYIFISESTDRFSLYRCDPDGGNRSLVLTREDVERILPENASLGQTYYDDLSLYLCYHLYSNEDSAGILKVNLTNNPKRDGDLQCSWMDLYMKPALRWYAGAVDNRILIRTSMEDLCLVDPRSGEYEISQDKITKLELPVEGGWLHKVWGNNGYFSVYNYDTGTWTMELVNMLTGEILSQIDAEGYGSSYYPTESLEFAMLDNGMGDSLRADWEKGELVPLTLVRWQGNSQIPIVPIARCGEEYLVEVRNILYSSFQIDRSGTVSTDPVYTGQLAFISVEDYLAGQPNYRIIQAAG